MEENHFTITASLWLYPGENGSWHFLTIPKDIGTRIKTRAHPVKRGWGSVRVRAHIGETTWDTSIFPDSRSGTYILPIKASVRRKEGVFEGDTVSFSITLLS
jgi:hypothetical protein